MKNSKKFAILVDQQENVPTLVNILEELKFVGQSKQQKQISSELLQIKNLLIFDKKETHDYEAVKPKKHLLEWLPDILGQKTYKMSKDFNVIVEELYLFAGKEPKKAKDMTIDIEIRVPKQEVKKVKKQHRVRVFTNFVKVGWDQYSIKIDPFTLYEYVIIRGNRYEVVRDVFGKGYLVEI